MGFSFGNAVSTFNKINSISNSVSSFNNTASFVQGIGSSIDVKSIASGIDLKNVTIDSIKNLPETLNGALQNSEKNIQNQLEKQMKDKMDSMMGDTANMQSQINELANDPSLIESGNFDENKVKEILGNNMSGIEFF